MESESRNLQVKLTPVQLFENKVDHTTYFGANLEYVHG
jgi:endoglucanase Acf2